MVKPIVIATRESRLAMWQAQHVRNLIERRFGHPVTLLPMTTRGDQILDRPLAKVGGKGLFIKELETALADGRADIAVHSLKDVPMALPDGFTLAAVLEREDPRDAFVSNRHGSLAELPAGAKVGTSSLRRVVQLKAMRPDLIVEPLRGNVDTRLAKLDASAHDAIVLAAAGLIRLGLGERIRLCFDPSEMLPCAGQGALGIEARSSDRALNDRLALFVDAPTRWAVTAERAVARALDASCSTPLAAYATWRGGALELRASLGHPLRHEAPLLHVQRSAPVAGSDEAEALGASVGQSLLDAGARGYLADAAEAAS